MKMDRLVAAGIAWLFVAAVAFQVFLAGVGLLGAGTMEGHMGFGYLIPLIGLVLLIMVAGARVPRSTGLAGLLFVLTLVQIALAYARLDAPYVAAFHPVNALLLWLLGVAIALRATSFARASSVAPASAAVADAEPAPRTA